MNDSFEEDLETVRTKMEDLFRKMQVSHQAAACITLAVVGLHLEVKDLMRTPACHQRMAMLQRYLRHKSILERVLSSNQ